MTDPQTNAQSASSRVMRAVSIMAILCGAIFLALLLHNHYQVLVYPYPLDYNEASITTITAQLLEGRNPFALEAQPAETSVYPITSNLLAAPFAHLFGNTFTLHRLVSLPFILLGAGLVAMVVYRKTRSPGSAFIGGSLAYAAFIFYSTPISGPNGLAVFLFLATVFVPLLRDFSRPSLLFALVLGIMAFYTKQYFMAGLGYIALYLFLARSMRDGLLFGIAFVVALLVSVPIAVTLAPYYFDMTLFNIGAAVPDYSSTEVMLNQLRDYSKIVYPLYGIILVFLVAVLRGRAESAEQHDAPQSGLFNLRDINGPLLNRPPDANLVYLACSVFIFVTLLGTNPGNYLSYLFQLVSPFLIVLAISLAHRSGRAQPLCLVLLVLAMYHGYMMQSRDFSVKHEENWDELARIIAESETVFVPNILLAEVVDNGLEVYQNGHTPYFALALFKPAAFRRDNYEESVAGIWDNYAKSIHRMIREQRFDVVLANYWTPIADTTPGVEPSVNGRKLLRKFYRKERTVKVAVANRPGGGTFPVEIWRPKSRPAMGGAVDSG